MTLDEPGVGQDSDVPSLRREYVRSLAIESGFSDAGVVALPHGETSRDAMRFEEWVDAGHAGTMHYLSRRSDEGALVRAKTAIPFPWARSVIVCFANYNSAQPRSIDEAAPNAGWIARYAWSSRIDKEGVTRPSDYHKVLLKRLRALESRLLEQMGAFESRAYVDTGPVTERTLAAAAGLGWTAKNTCLIHPKLGSFGFLAVLLTSLPVEDPTSTIVTDRCGTCRRCLDACPTGALTAPYRMDATRCISYLTIEHRGPIAEELREGMGRQIFGCDICQDVCPWNSPRRTPISADPELAARAELINPALEWLAAMSEADFEKTFNGSPVRRAGFTGLQRNIAAAMGNSGDQRFISRLQTWAEATDAGLRTAARWALEKLNVGLTSTGNQ
jgi:epoxyqueuosine reductase